VGMKLGVSGPKVSGEGGRARKERESPPRREATWQKGGEMSFVPWDARMRELGHQNHLARDKKLYGTREEPLAKCNEAEGYEKLRTVFPLLIHMRAWKGRGLGMYWHKKKNGQEQSKSNYTTGESKMVSDTGNDPLCF